MGTVSAANRSFAIILRRVLRDGSNPRPVAAEEYATGSFKRQIEAVRPLMLSLGE